MKKEEAIKLIDTHTVCFYNEIDSPTLQALHLAIEALSKGEQDLWIEKNSHTYICHNCGFEQAIYGNLNEYRYCPHCGKPKKGYECGWNERLFKNDEYICNTEGYYGRGE